LAGLGEECVASAAVIEAARAHAVFFQIIHGGLKGLPLPPWDPAGGNAEVWIRIRDGKKILYPNTAFAAERFGLAVAVQKSVVKKKEGKDGQSNVIANCSQFISDLMFTCGQLLRFEALDVFLPGIGANDLGKLMETGAAPNILRMKSGLEQPLVVSNDGVIVVEQTRGLFIGTKKPGVVMYLDADVVGSGIIEPGIVFDDKGMEVIIGGAQQLQYVQIGIQMFPVIGNCGANQCAAEAFRAEGKIGRKGRCHSEISVFDRLYKDAVPIVEDIQLGIIGVQHFAVAHQAISFPPLGRYFAVRRSRGQRCCAGADGGGLCGRFVLQFFQ